jgi:hypothetical protein
VFPQKIRKAVVCPVIDVISDETFEYITASDMTWGGFNWKLNFRSVLLDPGFLHKPPKRTSKFKEMPHNSPAF